jgi:hypothetical protein
MSQLYILASWYNYTLGTGWCVMSICSENVSDPRRASGEHFACFKNTAIAVAHFLSAQTRRREKYGGVDVVDVCLHTC